MKTRGTRASAINGFSLTELALAIGLAAACLVSLLAILGQSASQATDSARLADASLIQRNLRTRLLDPKFPDDRKAIDEGWEASLLLDGAGSVVQREDQAMFVAKLTSGPGLGYRSDYIERIEVELKASGGVRSLANFTLQRSLPINGKGGE